MKQWIDTKANKHVRYKNEAKMKVAAHSETVKGLKSQLKFTLHLMVCLDCSGLAYHLSD